MTTRPGMGPGTTPGPSGRRVEDRHQGRTFDVERARKATPQSLREVPDVTASDGPIYAGQAVHYNADTGLYEHQARILTFTLPGITDTIISADTPELTLPYPGCARHLHIDLTTAPTSVSCVVYLLIDGSVEATATAGSGDLFADAGVNDPVGIPIIASTTRLQVSCSASDGSGLTGWVTV